MHRSYKYRLYPTAGQVASMQGQLDIAREVYNACLDERRACYRATGKSLTYYDQANQLKAIRQECPDVATVNFSMLQATCRRAHRTYDAFYRRVKTGLKGGFPRFKGHHRFDSITLLHRWMQADGHAPETAGHRKREGEDAPSCRRGDQNGHVEA